MAQRPDLTFALSAAHNAMDLAVEHVLRHPPRQIRYKGDRDPVSDVDETVERLIHQCLAGAGGADVGFLGEETGPVGNRDTYWVLDPIDGTINHQHGNPLCAIALGLVHNEQPVLGVTALPFLGHRYSATEGGGAFRDDEPITTSNTDRLNKALIGFSDYGSGTDTGLRDVLCASLDHSLTARAQGLRRYGSSALDLVWVADGTLDACILLGNRTWDTAGGAVIAREAGARVLDSDASPHSVRSRCVVAVSPGLSEEVLPLLHPLRGSRFWPGSDQADHGSLACTAAEDSSGPTNETPRPSPTVT
ncbi:inositol monophosphatase [Amycolatopsis roodepoortensis]|uniref:inositol monophosphatase family protein n=1 Tax=Amycolatopsis roodepoortensis TaxID=700274 RepID=UPI00214B12B1|nr:inositol monophosphatase family protein [Amycolatopsis roodepoortensis]UUV28530.1 inositol monophosphatase [Amycolatopsis roodepoortensis]UUV36038.1 inositol monophosphatase [Amycolatopsis roodepoortensis]